MSFESLIHFCSAVLRKKNVSWFIYKFEHSLFSSTVADEQQKKLSQLDARGGCILPEKTFQDFIRISRDMLDKKYRNVHREVGDRF